MLAVASSTSENHQAAQELAKVLQLDFVSDPMTKAYDYVLVLTPDYLGLQKSTEAKFAPFYIDFVHGKIQYRSE